MTDFSAARPIRVVQITNTPAPYRVPALHLLAEQPDIDLTAIYCTTAYIDNSLSVGSHGNARVRFLKGRYWAMQRRFMHCDVGVWALLNKLKPDVVITTGYIPTFLLAFVWALWHEVPHVAMTDGTRSSEKGLTWLHRAVRRFVLRRSAAGIGACEGSLDLLRDYDVPEECLFKAPLAIFNERFAGNEPPLEQIDLLFCGRFVPHKRPDFALALAQELSRRMGRTVTLDFVGAGPEESRLRAMAFSMAGQVQVRFLGYASQQELPSRYAVAKIFLFPSEWDPWGVVANEACAAGVPVIVSTMAGAANELIRDGENGFVLPLVLGAWADAAASLLNDAILRKRMGQSGRARVKAFSFQAAAEAMAQAVNCAVGRSASKQVVIASLMRTTSTTGVQTHINAVCEYFDSVGQAWQVVTPFEGPRLALYGIVALRRGIEKLWPAAAVWVYRKGHAWLLGRALRPVLTQFVDCIVYAQCPLSADVALRMRRRGQTVTMVVHFNVSQADEWLGKGMIAARGTMYLAILSFEQAVLSRLDGLVCVSAWMQEQLLSRIPALAQVPMAVIPNFLNDPGCAQADVALTDLIAIGPLEPRKNQMYLLDVLAAARDSGVRLSLTLVGDGPDCAALVARAVVLGLTGQVRFTGFVKDGAELIKGHRALIHCAHLESFGIDLIEALGRGRPVFAPATGGMPEVFSDGVEGKVIPLDDPKASAQIVCAALANQGTLAKMAEAGRERFLDRFERRAVGAHLRDFLQTRSVLPSRPVVVLMQRRIMHYRLPVFQRLRDDLAMKGVIFRVAYGAHSEKKVLLNNDEATLTWGTPVPVRDLFGGALCWMNLRAAMQGADMVILMQENRMIFNYLVPFVYPKVARAFWGHGRNFQAQERFGFAERFKRWYLPYVDWWFGYTQISARIVEQAGFPRERLTVLNNAIDTEALEKDMASIDDAMSAERMAQWGVGSGPVGLVLGSLYSHKRLEFLLASAQSIRALQPDFELLIVGDGEQRELVQAAAQKSGGWIHWVGALKGRDKALALRRAQLLLNPGMVGLTILDGLVAGVPLVTCDIEIHSPEIAYLEHGRNGMMTAFNHHDYVETVINLLRDPTRREEMAAACREDAKRYNLHSMVNNFRDGILACLASAKVRS